MNKIKFWTKIKNPNNKGSKNKRHENSKEQNFKKQASWIVKKIWKKMLFFVSLSNLILKKSQLFLINKIRLYYVKSRIN